MIFEHENYYNSKGDVIPSVTTILKILNKPELVDWANFMGFLKINSKEYTNKAAKIGTLTHYYLERYGKNKIINYKNLYEFDDSIIKAVKKALRSFVQWEKDYNPKIKKCEVKINNENFGGTVDNICKIDGKKFIVDYKTSKGVYPSMFLQLAAYNLLLREIDNEEIDYVAILILNKNKVEYKFYKMEVKYLEKFYEPIFLLMYEMYIKWKTNLKTDWGIEL